MSDREEKINREVLAHKLIAGTATQGERDNALATILLSLWTFDDLRSAFETWHTDKCAKYPAKAHAVKAETERAANGGIIETLDEIKASLIRLAPPAGRRGDARRPPRRRHHQHGDRDRVALRHHFAGDISALLTLRARQMDHSD